MAKNAPFHIKSPVKNFSWSGQRGGASHRAPPKYATGGGALAETKILVHFSLASKDEICRQQF